VLCLDAVVVSRVPRIISGESIFCARTLAPQTLECARRSWSPRVIKLWLKIRLDGTRNLNHLIPPPVLIALVTRLGCHACSLVKQDMGRLSIDFCPNLPAKKEVIGF
jgi:hypothetical protein